MNVTEDVVFDGELRLPASALTWRFSRAGGPGGQGVNTTDSRVQLAADLTQLTGPEDVVARVRAELGDEMLVVASDDRKQLRNRQMALVRLVERIDQAAIPVTERKPTRPSAGAVAARLDGKRRRARRKADRRSTQPADW